MVKLNEIKEDELSTGQTGDYLKLKVGDNKVRIVSEFAKRVQHFKAGDCVGQGCQACLNVDNPPSSQYICWVIDRTDSKIKLAQFGMTIMKALKALSENPQYQFDIVPGYDITINRVGTTKEDTKYQLLPDRVDTQLTASETVEVQKLESPSKLILKFLDAQKKKLGLPVNEGEVNAKDIPF